MINNCKTNEKKPLKPGNYLVAQKILIDKTKNGENVPSLEVIEVDLLQHNLVININKQ